jgi:cytochrome P450
VRTVFTSGEQIRSGEQLASCTYLRAVIDETLRISPPGPGTFWRQLPVGEDGGKPLIVDGHVVPAGTWVGVNTYALHHNPEYFPDPFVFQPERFLVKGVDERKLLHEAFAPFSVGARSCIGKPMAYMEVSLVLAKTIWYFDFERPENEKLDTIGGGTKTGRNGRKHVKEFQLYDHFSSSHNGPYLVFRDRNRVRVSG